MNGRAPSGNGLSLSAELKADAAEYRASMEGWAAPRAETPLVWRASVALLVIPLVAALLGAFILYDWAAGRLRRR